jgi:two-component system sensor histidine kinase GlrK
MYQSNETHGRYFTRKGAGSPLGGYFAESGPSHNDKGAKLVYASNPGNFGGKAMTIFKSNLLMRLTMGYVAILLLVVSLGIFVSFKLNQLNHLIRAIAADGTTVTQLENLRDTLFSQIGFEKKYLVSQDPDFVKKFWELQKICKDSLTACAGRMDTPPKRQLFGDIQDLYTQYVALFEGESRRMEAGQERPSSRYTQRNEKLLDGINQRLNEIVNTVQTDRENKIHLSSRISVRMLHMTLFTALLTVFVGTLISFINTRKINRSIVMLKNKTKEIARGNYVQIPVIEGPAEIAELAEDFNGMSQKLKVLDEMKIDFINHVSHELRTPLTAIKEASEMLLEGTYRDAPQKQAQLLAITKEECERLIASVNRLLDFSRMEARMMEYRFTIANLVPSLQKTVLKLAPIAESRGISLELKPLFELPPVRADVERIEQVIENLIGNALKFTPENGWITVRAVPFEGKKGDLICVAVSDNGVGIETAHLSAIFEKFSRIETDGQTATGSGLGLTIVKHIVEDHGGEIWAKSEPGKGSTFYFVLPVA